MILGTTFANSESGNSLKGKSPIAEAFFLNKMIRYTLNKLNQFRNEKIKNQLFYTGVCDGLGGL